jgi:hypothetical protein
MTSDTPHGVTLGQFTLVFVIAGLLLVWALILPELGTDDLNTGRTRLLMWVVTLLLMPALGLYLFRSHSQAVANLSHLFWTAALLVFLVHTYWGAFIFYDGLADTFRGQGVPLASANFTLLTVWVVDVVLLWFAPNLRHGAMLHRLVRLLVFFLFSVDFLVGRTGSAHTLGIVFVIVVLIAGVVRFGVQRVRLVD